MVAHIKPSGSDKLFPAAQAAVTAGHSDPQSTSELLHRIAEHLETIARLREVVATRGDVIKEMKEAADPDTLDAIADEITSTPGDSFKHSARAASLRTLARRYRTAIAAAEKALK
jgi:DNA repair ATPase RecN